MPGLALPDPSSRLLAAFPQRIINIHLALSRPLAGRGCTACMLTGRSHSGAKYSGATVHIVTEEVDGGPIIRQEVVPVKDDDTSRPWRNGS